jgi:hypothetical protein
MVFKNGVKNIQTAGYNGARTVSKILSMVILVTFNRKDALVFTRNCFSCPGICYFANSNLKGSLVFTMNFVPVPIAKLEFGFRFEDGCNRTTAIVNSKCHGSINHLKNKVVPSTLDCQ